MKIDEDVLKILNEDNGLKPGFEYAGGIDIHFDLTKTLDGHYAIVHDKEKDEYLLSFRWPDEANFEFDKLKSLANSRFESIEMLKAAVNNKLLQRYSNSGFKVSNIKVKES